MGTWPQTSAMFALAKFLGMLAMPTGLLWLGLLGATAWAWRRQRGLGRFLAALTVLFTLAGNLQLGHALMGRLERQVPPFPDRDAPLEALFVLGGGTELDTAGAPLLGPSGDRVARAAQLWHSGRVRRLVASGAGSGGAHPRNLGAETRALWLGLGVPATAISMIEEPCLNTRQEIRAYGRLRRKEGWQRVGLLSSAWHLPRALALAQREGLAMVPVPADQQGRIPPWQLWHLVPQEEGFRQTQFACWEWLGRALGR